MASLIVNNLTKKFSGFTAVDDISFDVKEGEIIGLLGPNGAGKTTTIQMLLGIITPTSGDIRYFNKNFFNHKHYCLQYINYTSAFNTLQNRITVWENLLVFAHLYQIPHVEKKIDELAEYLEIKDLLKQVYGSLSSGQQTRVNIVKSLLNDPKVLLMDEPTASLDPDISDKLLTLIEKYRKNNNTSIVYTSHDMQEVTRICDRVIFLDRGKIVAQDTPLGLTKRIQEAQLRLIFNEDKKEVQNYLVEQKQTFKFEDAHTVIITTQESVIPKLIFGLSKKGIWISDIEVKKPTLEHVFLQIARGEDYVFEKS